MNSFIKTIFYYDLPQAKSDLEGLSDVKNALGITFPLNPSGGRANSGFTKSIAIKSVILSLLLVAFLSEKSKAELFEEQGLFGWKENGKVILEARYAFIRTYSTVLVVAEEVSPKPSSAELRDKTNFPLQNYFSESGFGFFDMKGQKKAGFNYERLRFTEKANSPCFFTSRKGNEGLWNARQQREVIKTDQDSVYLHTSGAVVIIKDGLYGTRNLSGGQILEQKYGYIFRPKNYLAVLCEECELQKDEKGKEILIGGRYGFANPENGVLIIPCLYQKVKPFHQGLAAVKIYDLWGYIRGNGIRATRFEYDSAETFESGKAKVSKGGKVFFINQNGECIEGCD